MFLSAIVRGCFNSQETAIEKDENNPINSQAVADQPQAASDNKKFLSFGQKVQVCLLSDSELNTSVKGPYNKKSTFSSFGGFNQTMDNPKPEEPGEIHIPSMTDADNGGNEQPKERTPESPGSRSNYGEFFWDTNGENDYHMSSLDDDFFMDSRGATAARLDRTQSDLNKFKQRIDNNVEQQREHSEMMANLQTKVHDYRKHLAQMEKKMAGESIRLPDKAMITHLNSDIVDTSSTYIRDVDIWSPSRALQTVSTALGGDSNANYEIRARLDDEIKRAEEFRSQWEHERSQRDHLEMENERLRSEFERYEQEFRDKERSYIHKNKNLTQYLSDEQQKMMDLWTDLQKVRKQFASLKQQTENDLENQKIEIRHMVQNITNAAGFDNTKRFAFGENINSSTSVDVMEILRDLRRGKDSHDKDFLMEHLKKINNVSDGEEITAEMYNGLVTRYENTINNNLELQKKLEEFESKNNEQAASLRKKEEQLTEAHRGLHRVLKLARRSDDKGLRTRSVSPVPDTVPATETINAVRQALRTRDHEIRRFSEKAAQQQAQLTEFEHKLKASEESKKRMDKQTEDARREIANNHKMIQEMERMRVRLDDRINAAQRDLETAEKARLTAQSEVQKLRNMMQETDKNNKNELVTQLESLTIKMEEDFNDNLSNIIRQNEVLSSENSKLKTEKRALEEKQAEFSTLNTTLSNEILTQNMKLTNMKSSLDKVQEDLKNAQELLMQKTSLIRNLESEKESNLKTMQKQDFKLQEIALQRDQLLKDKAAINEKIISLEHKYSASLKNKDEHERTLAGLRGELEEAMERLRERDAQFVHLNEANDNLDSTKRTYEGKIAQLEIDVSSRNSEIDKLVELNHKLQDERKDILSQKLSSDNQIEQLKEVTRKLEQDLNKTSIETKRLESRNEQNDGVVAHLEKEISNLQREISELKDENKELTDQINDLQERIRQKRAAGNSRRDKTGKSDPTTTTTTTTTVNIFGDKIGDKTEEGEEIYIPSHTPEHSRFDDDSKDDLDVNFTDDHLIMDVKLREMSDHWRQQLEELEKKNENLLKKRYESDQDIQTLQSEISSLKNEIKEKELSHEQQLAEMQRELKRLSERHIFENNIEREEAQENINQRDRSILELRQKIEKLQEALNDAENKVQAFESDRIENEMKINEFVDKVNHLKTELEESRSSSEKEIQKWKKDAYQTGTDNKVLEGSNMALKAELDSVTSKLNLLEKNNKEDNVKLRENIGTIRQLNEELHSLKDESLKKDDSISNLSVKMQDLKHQLDILTEQSNKWKYDSEYNQRMIENLEKIKNDLQNDLDNSKSKEKLLGDKLRDLKLVREQEKTEKDNLKRGLREKIQRLEEIVKINNKLKIEHDEAQTKLREFNNQVITSDSDRQRLERNLEKAVKELELCSMQLKRKTDEYQSAMGDLAHNQRVSEDGRLNAIQELESKKYENDDLKQRLSNMELRMANLQQDFVKVDSERDALTEEFARFHSSIRNMFNTRVKITDSIKLGRVMPSPKPDGGNAFAHDGTLITGDDIEIPFNTPGDYSVKTQLDISNIVSSINDILEKIREMERERSNLTDEIQHLRKKLSTDRNSTTKVDKTYRTIELNLSDIEDEKRVLQSSVDSLKEIIRNQEEAFKDRDEKRRKMKVAMAAMELEAKEKDAQIRHLKESAKKLKSKLDESLNESQNLKGKQIEYDANQFDNETRLRELERDALKYESTIAANENEKQISQSLITELKIELGNSEHKLEKLQEEVSYQKLEIQRLEKNESELKTLNERNSKSTHEHQLLKDQFTSLQNDFNNITVAKQNLENQLSDSKAEMRSMKQRSSDYQTRISELQRQIHDVNIEKHRLEERFVLIDKTNSQFLQKENELKQQLETVRNEKRMLEKEIDDLKRRVSQLEMEKRLNTTNAENASKEKQLLLKKIHMLELDKRNTDAAIKETALQREAIEKSLNAMERENKELYRNCAQLQQQIAQLEMENGNRILALTNKQRQEQEMLLMRIQEDKHQIEKVIDNKERTYKSRIKQLEQQISILREQIDTERRRKRDYNDKTFLGGLGPVNSSRTVLRSSYRDTTPSFGRNFSPFIPSTYVSNPLSPTSGLPTTAPTQPQGRTTESTIEDKEIDIPFNNSDA